MSGPHRTFRLIGRIGLALLAVAMAGIAISRYGLPWQEPDAGIERTQVAESSVRQAVAALGRIEPHSETIEVGAAIAGLVEELLVEEGQRVARGDTLGHLDSYRERVAERDQQAARLEEARAMLAAEAMLGEARIAAAKLLLRQTHEIYPLRIAAQQAKIALLSAELDNSRDILGERETLQMRAVGSRRNVDDQRTMVRKNEEEIAIARAELARLEAEQRMEALVAGVELQREEAALGRARAAVGLSSIEKDVALAEARLGRTIIRAPIDGQILKIVTQAGERVSEAPILQMGDLDTMHAVAEVYETDIGLVRIGQLATISSRSLPRALSGRVVQIGQLIFKNDVLDVDPSADADARVVEVRIAIDEGDLVEQLTNLTVDIVIDLDGEAVATAPPQATP